MHPYVPELRDQYRQGKITRREFLRVSALLGVSMASASAFLASCAPQPAAPAAPPTTTPAATGTLTPPAAPTAGASVKRGGTLIAVNPLRSFEDTATAGFDQYNVYRNVTEFLTVTGTDRVTRPWLLERFEPSTDLKSWTLYLRKGIKFNHGAELTADDVMFNIKRWLDPATKSATRNLMGSYLSPNNVEKIDAHTIKLHLTTPQLAVPEHLYHYNNAILPKDFEPPWSAHPLGTGPYTLEQYLPEERASLKKRPGYWRNGVDGNPLPYLDGLLFVSLSEGASALPGLISGEIDLTEIRVSNLDALASASGVEIVTVPSTAAHVIRMRADVAPFDDVRVRNAIKACQDRPAFLKATYRGHGDLGADHHVAPGHPEYCPIDPPKQDYEKAKSLLAEAGKSDGLRLKLSFANDETLTTIAQLLKSQCEPAGIQIELNPMPDTMYNDQWLDLDFGITMWKHRTLGVMTLDMAYKTGVAFNETHWSNKQFDELLTQANGTYDVVQRREIMCKLEQIMQQEGAICLPNWRALLYAKRSRVKGFQAAPEMWILDEVWLDA